MRRARLAICTPVCRLSITGWLALSVSPLWRWRTMFNTLVVLGALRRATLAALMCTSPCGVVMSLLSCRYCPPAVASTSPARLPTLLPCCSVLSLWLMVVLLWLPSVMLSPPLLNSPLFLTVRDSLA